MNPSADPRGPTLSAVLPLYGEAAHLPRVVERVARALDETGESWEIVLVDDGSSDDTWAVVRSQAASVPAVRGLRLSRNFGKESALCAGLEAARGAAVVTLDGDLQHPPELIPEMVRLWRDSDYDLVEAVKTSRGVEPWTVKLGSRVFYALLSGLSGHDLTDASDFKLMDRRVVDAWLSMGERNLFFRGMVSWLGFRRAQVPFDVPERAGGRSTWSVFRLARLALTAVTAFSSTPMQLVTVLGAVFFLFAAVLGVQTLYNKFAGIAVTGFTTVILLQLLVGGALMLSLGIIGAYIARIYEEVKRRPRYVVRERVGD